MKMTPLPSKRKRAGRHRRRAGRVDAAAPAAPAFITRRIPCYDLFDEENLQKIEAHADWILQEIGIEFRGEPTALELFRAAGASVDGERVRFDIGHVRALCSSAPREFEMRSRNPKRNLIIGGNRVVFAPAYGAPFVRDLEAGRHYGTLHDFEQFVKLAFMTPWLHHSGGTLCEPVDIPVNKRHLDMVYAHLRYSDKPFMGSVTSFERAKDSIEMARIAFGAEFTEQHCVIQANINSNSPLVYDATMMGALRAYAAANQGLVISPFIMGGAMGPVTQAASIAQAHAEAMAGIALSQLVRRGAPVIYGSFLTTMDLKTGVPTFGTPESSLATLTLGQLARRLGLPFRCGGHYTTSKIADAQAMQESADAIMAGLFAGANFILHAAGWLEGGLTIGYEKFILDADHCGMLQRLMGGLEINENELGLEAFQEIEPGGNFLGAGHTLANFAAANFRSELADTTSFDHWLGEGAKDAERRAFERCQKMLAAYEAPAMDPGVDEALCAFVEKKKSSMPNMWY